MDELVVYEGGEDEQQQPIDVDQDGQVDVCALEEEDNIVQASNTLISPASKRARNDGQSGVKVENDPIDVTNTENPADQQTRSERYRILRRAGNENLANRMRREPVKMPNVKNDDDFLLECEFL
jgi:hypothetical protein